MTRRNEFIEKVTQTLRDLAYTVKWGVRDRYRHLRAFLHRKRVSSVTFIGITGTAGKTSTKDMCAAVLAAAGSCHKTQSSKNEHESLDEAIRAVTSRHRFSVVEASATRPGYLDRSIRVIGPNIGVLTVIGREHFSAYRSLEAIAFEKRKLIDALPSDGIAVLNIDDPLVRTIGESRVGRTIWVGSDEKATIRLVEARSNWPEALVLRISYQNRAFEVRTRLNGLHLALPVMCALGVGVAAGLKIEEAIGALANAEPSEGRMQLETGDDGVTFLRDDWKAPWWSLALPLAFMKTARAKRKVVVLGTISDSPHSPSKRYRLAAQQALEVAELVVLAGVDTRGALKASGEQASGSVRAFPRVRDAAQFLQTELRAGDLVLLKGTNRQDHLVRLVLDRRRAVQCWEDRCDRGRFCGSCSKLYKVTAGPLDDGGERTTATQSATEAGAINCAPNEKSPVVVALGNPGRRFEHTPHNVGYRFVDELLRARGGSWAEQPEGFAAEIEIEGTQVTLLKPAALMNLTGPLIRRYLARTGRSPSDCIVVHDDIDLELGNVRQKLNGGDGGHKGVRSAIAALETDALQRVRLGVRRPGDSRKAKDIVLERFSSGDEAALSAGIGRAEATLRRLIADPCLTSLGCRSQDNRVPESRSLRSE